MAGSTQGRPDVDALVADLQGRGVAMVMGTVTGMAGVTRAKVVPLARLGSFAGSGVGASPSWHVFCVGSGIAVTSSTGVAGDQRIRLDAARLRVIDDGIAWAPGSFFTQDGTPSPLCARGLLAATAARGERAGLSALVGAELEFTLLAPDGSALEDGPWAPYGVRPTLARAQFLRELVQLGDQAGLRLEQLHAEFGEQQFEVSLPPTDPVGAADDVVLARLVIGRAAARCGLQVSFSPVPFAGAAGNGAHLHLSLSRGSVPVLSGGGGPHGMTADGASAVGGVLEALPGLIGVYAGSAVSAQRLAPGNWAGASACWGLENREAAVRFIAATPGTPHGANLELKVVDPTANPHLAVAALLGSALRGIERATPLPPEVADDPATAGVDLPELPLAQPAAIDALEGSAIARELLGAAVVEVVVAVRRYEIATYAGACDAEVADALRLAWTC